MSVSYKAYMVLLLAFNSAGPLQADNTHPNLAILAKLRPHSRLVPVFLL
jgi:hypothetical protein